MAVFSAQGWHPVQSRTVKGDVSIWDLWSHAPASDVDILSFLGVGGLLSVGFSGNHVHTVPPIPKERKQPTLEICGGKAQVTLSYKDGKYFLHLQRKEQRFSKL